MQKRNSVQSGMFNPRVLAALSLCCSGVFLAVFSLSATPSKKTTSFANRNGLTSTTVIPAAPTSDTGPTTNLSNGITFDHATWNDPIRMVGEPDIEIDNQGAIYVSGPGGTPTQTSWFWKSADKGIQWHIIGCPDKSNCQNGGGDTEITLARNRDLFASDLQTLQCNSTFRSFDGGQTFIPGEGCFPETDRQWMGVYDPNSSATGRRIYLAANGQAQGCYLLVSTDNGVTYTPPDPINNPTAVVDPVNGAGCIGRFAVDPNNGDIFVPTDGGRTFVSTNGGVSFTARGTNGAQGNFFAPIQMDTAGNLWQAWTDTSKAYLSYSVDRGVTWHAPMQISTGPASPIGTSPDLRQMIFPWMTVGDPGRVAVVFYATTDTQNDNSIPSIGGPNALWNVYATFSTNAMAANPAFTQVQATEHVMHRGAVCLGGFPGCLTANSDRSMADFFAVDKDPQGRVFIAYNENSDLSDVTQTGTEYIGKPINAVIRLRTGPSLFAAQGNLLPDPKPANVAITSASTNGGTVSVAGTHGLPPGNWTPDPAADAPFPVIPVTSANHPALDILEASVGDDGTNLTFKLKMADLSPTALADAATSGGTPTWMVTWWEGKNGIGPSGVTSGPFHSHWFVKCLNATTAAPQFAYGKVSSIDFAALGAPTPKFLTYVPAGTATGNVTGNVITITVPLANVGPLVAGDKLDHILTYGLVEHASDPTLNDWADQAKSFSYVIGTPAAAQHFPDGYVQVSTDNFVTSTLATLNAANNAWTASLPTPASGIVCARQVLAKDLYTTVWDDVQAGPPTCATLTGPTPISLVSHKVHGTAGSFDITMPLMGTPGIEPRGSGPINNYTLIYTFPAGLTGVVGANVATHNPTNGTGMVQSMSIGPNSNQLTINLTGVSTGQYLTVAVNGVSDPTGTNSFTSPEIGILVGDVDANGRVDGNDVSAVQSHTRQVPNATTFMFDVDANGRIDGNDVSDTQTQTRTGLPTPP